MRRRSEREDDAGRAVARTVGGHHEINDTGAEPGQFDVLVVTASGRTIALEVTSFGGDDWRRTAARIDKQEREGRFAGETLRYQWWVITPSGGDIRALQPRLERILARLERMGARFAKSRYQGDDAILREVAVELSDLRVNSVTVLNEAPPRDEPRIVVSQSDSNIGTAGALPAALRHVLEKRDNQEKLARADVDERHLYVFMEDGGAQAVLEGRWPLPECPADPTGVIDTVWVYSPSVSAYLFEVRPGTRAWRTYVAATGDPWSQ